MNVVWTYEALSDRDRIVRYIDSDNPDAAINLDNLFEDSSDSLAIFPYKGREGRLPNTRELVVHPSYILIYGIDEKSQNVYIKTILHTSQLYPPE